MSCLRCFQNFWDHLGEWCQSTPHLKLIELPHVSLDTTNMGAEAVIIKNGRRVCGTGAALCNTSISQSKAYFEAKVQQTGIWGVGISSRKSNLNKIPMGTDSESVVLRHDGQVFHNNVVIGKSEKDLEEGDVIGITYDHSSLKFYVEGRCISDCHIEGQKPSVPYPLFYVDDGAVLDAFFCDFNYPIPFGYQQLIIEQSIL